MEDKEAEFLRMMEDAIKMTDYEDAHVMADEILCDFLLWLGHKSIVDAFKEVGKWYA